MTAMSPAPYILKWRMLADASTDFEEVTSISLVGPFDTSGEACTWAREDQVRDGDDPRWQLVHLVTTASFYPVPISPAPGEQP